MGVFKLTIGIRLAVAALVVLAVSAKAEEAGSDVNPGHAQSVNAGGASLIYLSGGVGSTMLAEFSKIAGNLQPGTKELIVHLNSTGGDVDLGSAIIGILKDQRELGRRVTTVVKNGDKCVSICIPIFMAGEVRKAGPAASFMFHAIHNSVLVRFVLPKQVARTRKLLEDSGVKRDFVDRLYDEGVLASFTGYWMTGRELADENTGMVTELLPRLDQGIEFNFGGLKFGL